MDIFFDFHSNIALCAPGFSEIYGNLYTKYKQD